MPMKHLANKWRQADVKEDILRSARDFNQTVAEREKRAREDLRRIRVEDVPNGIQSCIARGGRVLGLPLDSAFLGTRALSEFLEWCEKQDLCVGVETEGPNEALLLISPIE